MLSLPRPGLGSRRPAARPCPRLSTEPAVFPPRRTASRWLDAATVGYVVLPYLIFAVGWLKPWVAALVVAAVGVWGATAFRRRRRAEAQPGQPRTSWGVLACAAVVTIVWLIPSGCGGCGFQNIDYLKHNAILRDLVAGHWPVAYLPDPAPAGYHDTAPTPRLASGAYLSYYLAYYLPPAAVGKAVGWARGGWEVANAAMWVWTAGGVFLALLWVARLMPSRPVVGVLLFPLMGCPHLLGRVLMSFQGCGELLAGAGWADEWWAKFGSYQTNATFLYWTPQHGIPAWLLTAWLYRDATVGRTCRNALLIPVLATLWSPFVAVGLIPLAVVAVWRTGRAGLWSIQNVVAAPLLGGLAALYLHGHEGVAHGFIWDVEYDDTLLLRWAAFCLTEFLAMAVLVALAVRGRGDRAVLPWLAAVVVALFGLTAYKLGTYNDLMMRGSIPPLLVLWLITLQVLLAPAVPSSGVGGRQVVPTAARCLLAVAVCCSAAWSLAAMAGQADKFVVKVKPFPATESVAVVHPWLVQQYLVPRDMPFFRLCKPLKVPPPVEGAGGEAPAAP